jgi:hypothetical protein
MFLISKRTIEQYFLFLFFLVMVCAVVVFFADYPLFHSLFLWPVALLSGTATLPVQGIEDEVLGFFPFLLSILATFLFWSIVGTTALVLAWALKSLRDGDLIGLPLQTSLVLPPRLP